MSHLGRPRVVDREVAIQRAMLLFWRQGFERTSVDELVAATGLQRELGIYHDGALPLGMQGPMGLEHPNAYLPTVVVLDAEGVVRSVLDTDNYRVRPEPRVFLGVLRDAGVSIAA